MISAFQIARLKLPQMFVFDALRLYAKFQSTTAELALLTFQAAQLERGRQINLNVQLKIPSSRSFFVLFLQVIIINMPLNPVKMSIDLHEMTEYSQYSLIFQTEMGSVEVDVNLIEEIYLPKEEIPIRNTRSCIVQNKEQMEASAHSHSSVNEDYKVMASSTLEGTKEGERSRPLSKKYFSSRRRYDSKIQKMSLSRSEYMKLQVEDSLIISECKTETESELLTKRSAVN